MLRLSNVRTWLTSWNAAEHDPPRPVRLTTASLYLEVREATPFDKPPPVNPSRRRSRFTQMT